MKQTSSSCYSKLAVNVCNKPMFFSKGSHANFVELTSLIMCLKVVCL